MKLLLLSISVMATATAFMIVPPKTLHCCRHSLLDHHEPRNNKGFCLLRQQYDEWLEEDTEDDIDDECPLEEGTPIIDNPYSVDSNDPTMFTMRRLLELHRSDDWFALREFLVKRDNGIFTFADQFTGSSDWAPSDVEFLQSLDWSDIDLGLHVTTVLPFACKLANNNKQEQPITAQCIIDSLRPKSFQSDVISSLNVTELAFTDSKGGCCNPMDVIHTQSSASYICFGDNHDKLLAYSYQGGGPVWHVILNSRNDAGETILNGDLLLFSVVVTPDKKHLVGLLGVSFTKLL